MYSVIALLLLAMAPPAPAADDAVLALPKTWEARPYTFFVLKPTTNCKSVKWVVPAGVNVLPPEIPVSDPTVLIGTAGPGTYTISAYGAKGDEATDLATCTLTVADPTPPPPADPLSAAVSAAYSKETAPTKRDHALLMAALYRQAAAGPVKDQSLKTVGDLFNVLKTAAGNLIPADALPLVRAAIAAELAKVLPTSAAALLGDVERAAAAAAFLKIAAVLGGL